MDSTNIQESLFEVVLGTYEEFVIGFNFKEESKTLVESFATHSHQGSIRSVACTSSLIASGGSDEVIQLYNMTTRKEAGTVMEQTGTITSIQFTPEGSHLISCSQEGSIAIYRVGSWQMEKLWMTAHKGAGVSCIAIHPSSKMALSLGQNKTLRTWNLIKGRPAYTTNLSGLGKYIDSVIWSVEGQYYALSVDNQILVFDVSIAGVIFTIECTSRITAMSFFENGIICFGEENGWIICHCVKSNKELWRVKTGDIRVKCLTCIKSKWLISANSDGQIIVWEVVDMKNQPTKVATANVGCRITCMSVRIPVKLEND